MHSSVFNLLVHVCKIMIHHTWFVMPAVDNNIDGDSAGGVGGGGGGNLSLQDQFEQNIESYESSCVSHSLASRQTVLLPGFHLLGVGELASHPKRLTISLHHRQQHYTTETLLLKKKFN